MKITTQYVFLALGEIAFGLSTPNYPTRSIAGIAVPDTPTINKTIAYARANLDDHAYNHVMRAWLAGQASISHLPTDVTKDVDLEAIAVSAILHDLGWSKNPAIISPNKRFEIDGADATRSFLRTEGEGDWNERRIQLVWDAIALHTSRDIALYKEKEVWMVSAGILTELVSPNITRRTLGSERVATTMEEWEAINNEFPRNGLRQFFNGVMIGLCMTKPATTYNNFVADYGERYVEGYTEVGQRTIDFFELNLKE